MTEFSNDLLKEAIADANAVRETAVANAKLQLEEALTPRVQEEISKILRQEQEEADEAYNPHKGQEANDFAKVGEGINPGSSGVGTGDNKEPSSDAKSSSGAGNDGGQEIMDGEHTKAEKHESLPGKDEEMKDAPAPGKNVNEEYEEDEEDEEQLEEELDLRRIITQLQAEVDAMERDNGDEDWDDEEYGDDYEDTPDPDLEFEPSEFDPDDDGEAEPDMFDDEDEEELDLEAILGEIEAELAEEEELEVAQENVKLKEDLSEAYGAVKLLRDRLNEVNLLNAKLLFTNKLFRGRDLNNEQKKHVVETFDLATTLREVRLLYATLAEATIPAGKKRKKADSTKVVTEGIASSVVGGPNPAKDVEKDGQKPDVNEGVRSRLQQLAGIQVLND